jgi:NAD(P)-dependent dehydrogenase (short-subunit alcohol dehydrogenase family)
VSTLPGTIVITGASRGIGAATAALAAEAGYRVCINYRRESAAADMIVRDIVASGGDAIAVAADVSNQADVQAMFAEAENRLGPLAVLVNNAGVVATQAAFDEIDTARFNRILGTNVIGAFNCAQEALRRMSTTRGGAGGAIVNVSSVAARTGSPFEYVDYAASKGALDTMSAGLAREAGPQGVRVNLVRPGFIYTDMHASGGEPDRVDRLAPDIPLQRGGHPAEVARAILWLASAAAGYVAGTTLDITGGV